ncbi:M50 family metallopeptidase [Nocardioides donggukensis]|uniref:Site-2 protease family protein n=1 Tax=Nocardioides donggukensis TaxID=2774019 RepID=A0A927K4R0_9ACTN|nr:M50 family metallopeptidase [Nocardioides donggukensis]MBD8869060.1 site-2 protease family protein [Nocardioides donggukensis]
MSALYYTLGVVIFVVAILGSIALHELGHLYWAKRFGGKVTQYFVGFGNTLWSKRVGETEYGIKSIPLGGFVKIVGMLPPDDQGRLRQSNTGMFTQLVADARAAEAEHIQEGDEHRLFYRMSWWKKVVVMAAGPSVNIAIAFVIFGAIFATYGNPADRVAEPVVAAVQPCVVPAAEENRECTASDPASPAAIAGLREGDRFVAFNGAPLTDWASVQQAIRTNEAGSAEIVVLRDGERVTLTTDTLVRPMNTDATDRDQRESVGFLGVVPETYLRSGGLLYTLDEMGTMTVRTVEALVDLPVKVWGVAQAIVGVQERDPEGPMSVVGGGRIAGETASNELFPVMDRGVFLLMLIAGFNFFIGMFNFVPLLPLDGGHIAGALYEAVRRGWARLRRRPDPGYVDVAKLLPVAYVVAGAFLVMSVVLIVGDLVVPIRFS